MDLENRPAGTGIFDDDDHALMNNEPAEVQKEDSPSTARNFIAFMVVIILIIIFAHHNSLTASPALADQKEQIKKQLLDPIFEEIKQDPHDLDQNTQSKLNNQTLNNQLASLLPPIQSAIEEIGYEETEHKNQGKSLQPDVPASPKGLQPPIDKNHKKTESNMAKQAGIEPSSASKGKIYPVSQQIYDSRIYAGEIHYSRIPVEYWQHRILMVKAMGLNTLSVYVMWNYHEMERERFDYATENKNIAKFLELAAKHKMKVLLRPGPYVCAEWDFGGLPARLLGIKGLTIRTSNTHYLDEVQIYFKSLAPLIKPYLLSNDGPIHMIQIENELGSARTAPEYPKALVNMWHDLGIECQFYVQDAARYVSKNYFPGAAIGLSDGSHEMDYSMVGMNKMVHNDTLIFGGEIYTGWMTHWGERWGNNLVEKFRLEMEYLFQTQKQFSLYMAHGGTNFGLTAGANAGINAFDYEPMVTSYDYNATISEQGRKTVKSDLIVDLMNMYVRPPEIPFPDPIPTIQFDEINPKLAASLLQNLGEPALKDQKELYFFEHEKLAMYHQGIVLYETFLTTNRYFLNLTVHDFALIFLDGELVDHHSRIRTDQFQTEINCEKAKCRLLILVEAMGHNNYGANQQDDIKGLLRCDIYAKKELFEALWNFYKVNIDESIFKMDKISSQDIKYPAILKQKFNLKTPGDTYINMENYIKGYVWINGRNLGRYWSRGPQLRLYCPGVWLKKENNEIVILDFLSAEEDDITGEHTLEDSQK